MRILLITQYFTPEVTAASARLHPWARGLAELGHSVEVVCEAPSHPSGTVEPGYRRFPGRRRRLDGFEVTYVRNTTGTSKRARTRLASYASYAAFAAAVAAATRRPDVVIASSPPLSVGAVGALVARAHRVPWVFDVRDLWPEVAIALGELGPGRVADLAEGLERRLYDSAGAVTTPTESFAGHIRGICAEPAKVEVLPNGTTRAWLELGEQAAAPRESESKRFVWTYAGNVGLSQDLDTAVAAAGLLGQGYELSILGTGASRERLEQKAGELPAGSVSFGGLLEPLEAARRMRASDALLVSLADDPALAKSLPIKVYDSCAVGRPLVVAAPGEARRVAEREGFALVVSPEDPVGLAAAVARLAGDAHLRSELAGAALAFAGRNLREDRIADLDRILRGLTA